MKIFVFVLFVILMTAPACAQSFDLGIAGVYGDDIKEPGLNIRGDYSFKKEAFGIGPEFTIFRKRKELVNSEQVETFLYEFNVNGHYRFELTENIGAYPFVGVNFSREKEEIDLGSSIEKSVNEALGMNLGLGIEYRLDNRFKCFLEFDHVFSELRENTFSLGVFYRFGNEQEEKKE